MAIMNRSGNWVPMQQDTIKIQANETRYFQEKLKSATDQTEYENKKNMRAELNLNSITQRNTAEAEEVERAY